MAAVGRLTDKMKSFVDAYFGEAQMNATKAYYLSNYAITTKNKSTIDKNVSELMAHPLIKEEIARRWEIKEKKSEIKAEYLLNKLMEIIEDEQKKNPQASLRAIELAGKSIALWKERQEISGPDGEAIKHEQHVKESVADFTNKLQSLTSKSQPSRAVGEDGPEGQTNVVGFPKRA